MAKYLLIESRDPFENTGVAHNYELAAGLARDGNDVQLFLVENGVLAARPSTQAGTVKAAVDAGVTVLADDFSLRERGIDSSRLVSGIAAAPLDTVIDGLAEGRKAIWD